MGVESDIMNWFEQTCANGHVIGQDGNHIVLSGLDRWLETSFVGAGAADHAKVVGRSRQIMAKGNAEYQRLAASATPQHAHAHTILFASATHQEKPTMADTNEAGVAALTTQIITLSTSVGTLTADKAGLTASVTAITAERDALTVKVTELNASVAAGAANAALKADHDTMLAFLQDQSLKAQTAAGVKETDLKKLDKPADLIASLTENGKHIALLLAGTTVAKANGADALTGGKDATVNLAASNSFRMAR
jgi:regulator of replication initiation timing